MIKRLFIIFLCISMILTAACSSGQNDPVESHANESSLQPVWTELSTYKNTEVEYETTKQTWEIPEYHVNNDLSNLENINRIHGFTENQKEMLAQNGFIVLPPNPKKSNLMKMYSIYESNEYNQTPNFVTTDMALHLYHKFYSETLKSIEKEYFLEELQILTARMLGKTLNLYEAEGYDEVKEDLKEILIFFSVSNKILNDSYGSVSDEVKKVAEEEIDLIKKSEGYSASPLMGFDINYEQFVVRGHYAGDEVLEKYFKGMMWYGLLGFPLKEEKELNVPGTVKAMLISTITFLEDQGKNDIEAWDKIYAPTDFFVGQSDDITIFNMKDVIINVFGDEPDINDFRDESYYEKLLEEVNKLPEPRIQNKLVLGVVDTPTQKQFRFMGQRYTLDANILQELMFPIIRPVPSGLDVAAAFGNQHAEELDYQYYVPKTGLGLEKHKENLPKMKSKVSEIKENEWMSNLYNGWLWNIKAVLKDYENHDGLPFFMKNMAWRDKNINTALGSYAELKHDTVLYAKQPVAEMGGPAEIPYLPQYVEPNVEVYEKLVWLVDYSSQNLKKRGLLDEQKANGAEHLLNLYKLLRDCSLKEMNNEPLTEEENSRLKYIGGAMELIEASFSSDYDIPLAPALVSDIAGIADVGAFLEIGTEFPNEIYVAIYDQGKIYLARGAVFGYHEFLSDEPLTDAKWHEMLGIEKIKHDDWEYEQINLEKFMKEAPKQPEWVYSFKSHEENQVQIDSVEYVPQ